MAYYFRDRLPPSYLIWPKLNTMKHFVTLAALLTSLVALAQTPQLPFNPDENGDGLIGVADLQSFLALYNTEFSAAVSANGIAFINLGGMNKDECQTSCNNLPGSWDVTTYKEVSKNWQLVAESINSDPTTIDSPAFWVTNRDERHDVLDRDAFYFNKVGESWYVAGLSSTYDYYDRLCVCSITERPKIEYQRIVQDGSGPTMNTIVNELLNEGWYILSTDELFMHLWRWKD